MLVPQRSRLQAKAISPTVADPRPRPPVLPPARPLQPLLVPGAPPVLVSMHVKARVSLPPLLTGRPGGRGPEGGGDTWRMESIVWVCRRPTREAELALTCNGEARASSRTGFHLPWRQAQVAAAGPLVCLGETSSRSPCGLSLLLLQFFFSLLFGVPRVLSLSPTLHARPTVLWGGAVTNQAAVRCSRNRSQQAARPGLPPQ